MKTINNYLPFSFQADTISKLLDIVEHNHGACIFDETGLGKTITAATVAINLTKGKINVLSPKVNQSSWNDVLGNSENSFEVFTFKTLPKTSCEVLIIDEAHNLKNEKSQSFIQVFEYVKVYNPIVLLLTATPFQNTIRELRNIISLINFRTNTPAFIQLGVLFDTAIEAEKKIKANSRYNALNVWETSKVEWEKSDTVKEIADVITTFTVRNTRTDIAKKYMDDVALMGHFPITQTHNFSNFFTLDENVIIGKIIAVLEDMKFALQNAPFYSTHPRYKTNQSFKGIAKTFLLKRLDSSVNAFKCSLETMKASIERELSKDSHTVLIDKAEYPLSDSYTLHLTADLADTEKIIELASGLNDSGKLAALNNIVAGKKAIIFTEYKDTLNILRENFSSNNRVIFYTSDTPEKVLETIQENFDANTWCKDDYDILCATDVLSEGVNLHRADILVHFDQKWNPSRLTQRNGRVNRITKTGVKREIDIYFFQVETVIETIIKLNSKIASKEQLSSDFLAGDPPTYHNFKNFKKNCTISFEGCKTKSDYNVFETPFGHIIMTVPIFGRGDKKFIKEAIETSNEVTIKEGIDKMFKNCQVGHLLGGTNIEFNGLYKDAWYELAKSKSSGQTTLESIEQTVSCVVREPINMCYIILR
jgi:superfamily II DNA or RNA helicase